MLPFTRRKRASAIVILAFGVGLVIYGYIIIVLGDISFENAEKESSIPTIRHSAWEYNVEKTLPDHKKVQINTSFFSQTREVFAVDNPINYTITTTVFGTYDIKQIWWFFDNNQHDFAKQYGSNMDLAIPAAQAGGIFVNLTQHDSSHYIFEKTHYWNDTVPEQVTMYGEAITQNHTAYPIGSSDVLYTVDSPVAYLQAQTDRDLIKQSHESDKTNAHVEGLTIIIIGLIPLGIVGEIIVERWWVG